MSDVDGFLPASSLPPGYARPTELRPAIGQPTQAEWRLRKHADYQRVYQAGRKHFSPSMSYFYALRPPVEGDAACGPRQVLNARGGPRIGLTAGKVLGNAVARNRIKRRMREAVRKNVGTITSDVDVILHPRKFVATIEFVKLEAEVGRVFATVQTAVDRAAKDGESS